MKKAKRNGTKVITGKVRLNYTHLLKPHGMEGSEPRYSTNVIIDKNDKDTLKEINDAINEAKEKGKAKFGGKIPSNIKIPLRDGEDEKPDDKAYENSYFLNANNKNKPVILGPRLENITDETEIYSGIYAKLILEFYPYSVSGNKGIAVSLCGVQKVEDGEPLGAFKREKLQFEAIESEDDFLN